MYFSMFYPLNIHKLYRILSNYFCQVPYTVYFFIQYCRILHNVPAVYDVPVHPIKQTVGLLVGWNVGEAGVETSVATDLAERSPPILWVEGRKRRCVYRLLNAICP